MADILGLIVRHNEDTKIATISLIGGENISVKFAHTVDTAVEEKIKIGVATKGGCVVKLVGEKNQLPANPNEVCLANEAERRAFDAQLMARVQKLNIEIRRSLTNGVVFTRKG